MRLLIALALNGLLFGGIGVSAYGMARRLRAWELIGVILTCIGALGLVVLSTTP